MPPISKIERLPIIQYGDLSIDLQCYIVTMGGEEVHMFPKEFEILCLLVQHPNWVFSVKQIYENVWQEELIGDGHTVCNAIYQIRHKLGRPDIIRTVVGFGYKFVP